MSLKNMSSIERYQCEAKSHVVCIKGFAESMECLTTTMSKLTDGQQLAITTLLRIVTKQMGF